MMGCHFCDWWDRVSECTGICGCPDGRKCGEFTGGSDSCGKWTMKVVPATFKEEMSHKKERKVYEPSPERLDASFLIEFVRHNSRFDADLLERIIEEWKQFKKLGSCEECKHWHEETAYCELNSYFVDHEGLCCSPAESQNWTTWDKDEFCSRFERIADNGSV